MKNIARLKGSLVNLCPLRSDDEAVHTYMDWMEDEEGLKFIGRARKVDSFESQKAWAKEASTDKVDLHFNIVTTEDNLIIGNCDIDTGRPERNISIGIFIGNPKFRGNGYGSDALAVMLKFCFEELEAHNVELNVRSDNARAIKCYQKLGFKVCGRTRETTWSGGQWLDTIKMQILASEYFH